MLALDNIKVLDVTRGYPGSYGAMFLGDFGAQIIRVDPPLPPAGSEGRGRVNFDSSERFAAFNPCDRNKKSITLDLKTPAARQVLYRLAKTVDILIENSRPGVMKRLKCDYDTLKEINPRLIYCACSGFGQDGPYAALPGHDPNYIAIAGALSLVGPKDGMPCLPSNFVGDMGGCALHAAIGMLIALLARERTGRGQLVDVSYLDGAMSVMMAGATQYLYTGKVPKREGASSGGRLSGQIYKCKDGEYCTVVGSEKPLWDNFCRAIGREDLMDKRRATGEEKDRIVAELSQIFITKTRYEWFEFFKGKDVCCGPVNNIDEAFRDPHVLHRKMLLEFDHPTVGKVRQLGIPIKLSDTPGSVRSLGVPIGANTEEVLTDIGYSKDDIEDLRRQGALG